MKKILFISLLVLLFTIPSWGQLQQVWMKRFTFGLDNGQPFALFVDDSCILTAGYVADFSNGKTVAALMKFGTDGDTLWSRIGNHWSESGYESIARIGGRIFWTQSTWQGNDTLVGLNLNGDRLFSKELPYRDVSIAAAPDSSLILVSGETIALMDRDGTILKSAVFSPSNLGGVMTLKVLGNSLFLTAISTGSTYDGTVIRIDLATLKPLWETHIQNIDRCFADIDAEGNTYFGGSKMVKDTAAPGFHELWYAKISPEGAMLVEHGWYPRNTYETNYENWVNGVAYRNGIVVMGGHIQYGDTHTGESSAYLATLNASDGRKTWDTAWIYGGLIVHQIENLAFAPDGYLIALGNAAGPYLNWLHKYKLLVTDVSPETNVIPKNVALLQNYPNPFNPSTKIQYVVSSMSYVVLKVYDVLGREVKTLVNEEQSAGSYSVTFDGSNLPSGTYFYRLQTDNGFAETKKMVLVK